MLKEPVRNIFSEPQFPYLQNGAIHSTGRVVVKVEWSLQSLGNWAGEVPRLAMCLPGEREDLSSIPRACLRNAGHGDVHLSSKHWGSRDKWICETS